MTDADYWQLTPHQRVKYHARLARYHADRAVVFAGRSRRLAKVSIVFGALSFVAALIGLAVL